MQLTILRNYWVDKYLLLSLCTFNNYIRECSFDYLDSNISKEPIAVTANPQLRRVLHATALGISKRLLITNLL